MYTHTYDTQTNLTLRRGRSPVRPVPTDTTLSTSLEPRIARHEPYQQGNVRRLQAGNA